jgi:hypothetical protein
MPSIKKEQISNLKKESAGTSKKEVIAAKVLKKEEFIVPSKDAAVPKGQLPKKEDVKVVPKKEVVKKEATPIAKKEAGGLLQNVLQKQHTETILKTTQVNGKASFVIPEIPSE